MDETRIQVILQGSSHSIDAEVYGAFLRNYADVIKGVNRILEPAIDTEVRVYAERSGSFIVDIAVGLINFSQTLFSDPLSTITSLAAIVTVTKGIYEGIHFLSEHRNNKDNDIADESSDVSGPENDEIKSEGFNDSGSIIINGDSHITINRNAFNIISEPNEIVSSACKSIGVLERDKSIEAITFEVHSSDSETESLTIRRGSFPAFKGYQESIQEQNIPYRVADNTSKIATVTVLRPVLEKSETKRWKIKYGDIEAGAVIKDDDFIKHLGDYRFTINTTMKVLLEEVHKSNGNLNYYIINKVIEVSNPPENYPLI